MPLLRREWCVCVLCIIFKMSALFVVIVSHFTFGVTKFGNNCE
jgi:hypothetical protein